MLPAQIHTYHPKCQYSLCYFVPAVTLSAQVSHFWKYLISGERCVSDLFVLYCWWQNTQRIWVSTVSITWHLLTPRNSAKQNQLDFNLLCCGNADISDSVPFLSVKYQLCPGPFSCSLCWQEKPAIKARQLLVESTVRTLFFFFPNPADEHVRAHHVCLSFISVLC